ncbi:MAG TPA: FKBP-type peptidyl-prolyl cis-trans isomerase [Dehalococcoidia bacterium]|nr:FKBP-type peptidyl-prolyl cis-trans isomerase [Dehalococcoidia bacterium]
MRTTVVLAVFLLTVACSKPSGGAAPARDPESENEKVFYALGASFGRSLTGLNPTGPELEMVQRGMADSVTGKKLIASPKEYGPKIQELARVRGQAKASLEKEKAQAFLEKAAAEPGAQQLPSGLIYFELRPGTVEQPQATERVKVHFRGTLTDGTEVDSSYERGQPAEFPIYGVMPCWTEGLQKMKVGGKAKLICPSAIAYGDQGRPPTVPGGATLVFEVELLEVVHR